MLPGSLYADIILPLVLQRVYTFSVPEEMATAVKAGLRVEVQFGRNKHYTGIVKEVHGTAPAHGDRAKPILSVIDLEPLITARQIQLWEWVADYYACTLGEVMNAGLPSHLKLTSETIVTLGPLFSDDATQLDDQEYMIVEALTLQQELTLKDIRDILQRKTVYPVIRRLLDRHIVFLKEELQEKYKPKVARCVRFTKQYLTEAEQIAAFELVSRSEKQTAVLLEFLQVARDQEFVQRTDLTKRTGASDAVIKAMVKKGIFEFYEREISRIGAAEELSGEERSLSEEQVRARAQVRSLLDGGKPALIHGVTGSGKTHLYIEEMKRCFADGQQVLYLLPEIALTSQLVKRLQRELGDKIAVYHSRLSNMERVEIWRAVLAGEKSIVGPRSAIFLPYRKLGLVIVDEEHDQSFKQTLKAPFYHGRDVAMVLAHMHKAGVILGTATPSLESWENARKGKYGLVSLTERYGGLEMPEIVIADARETDEKGGRHPFFTPTLRKEIKATLERGEQVILFQNRRGFAPVYFCPTCDHSIGCVNCDVSLTYHKFQNRLRCHCCAYVTSVPETCPSCGNTGMQLSGTGTQKVEDELKIFFPDIRIGRMDADTTRGKNAMGNLIGRFEAGQLNVLVGTQMVTKGLDFDRVGLVGIISADQLLRFPDFRADERAYQLMVQVAGRAGRKHRRGKVIIQAMETNHPILRHVVSGDWAAFIDRERTNRAEHAFPPYQRMIHIQLRHTRPHTVEEAAKLMGGWLAHALGDRVTPPFQPAVSRLRTYYLMDMVVRVPNKPAELKRAKEMIGRAVDKLSTTKGLTGVRVVVDVDPY